MRGLRTLSLTARVRATCRVWMDPHAPRSQLMPWGEDSVAVGLVKGAQPGRVVSRWGDRAEWTTLPDTHL